METVRIPDYEYKERVTKTAKLLAEKNFDAMLLVAIEGDFQQVKYFTSVSPVWERLGVIISASGEAAMLTGPEGLTYCEHFTKLDKVYPLNSFRSSQDPIPGAFVLSELPEIFKAMGIPTHARLALGNTIDMTMPIYNDIKKSLPSADLVDAPEIMREIRTVKSANELKCLQESYRLTELATEECLKQIRPGMTECNIMGIAHSVIFANGAEAEGMPNYVFCDKASRYPLARASADRILKKDSFLQLGLSASVDGYCGSIGIPVSLGKFTDKQKKLVDFGFELHKWVRENARAGMSMQEFGNEYKQKFVQSNMEKHFVYGPLHGVGLAEVEATRVNQNDNNYITKVNSTYQMDNFLLDDDFGFRWETGLCLVENGNIPLSKPLGKYYELGF